MSTLFIAVLLILGLAALIMSGAITLVLAFIFECWPLLLVIVIFMFWRKSKRTGNKD